MEPKKAQQLSFQLFAMNSDGEEGRQEGKVLNDPVEEIALQENIAEDEPPHQEEYDFVERPSEDFFCPVTFELLLDPHQTTCCGNHLSEKAAKKLKDAGKPCPMCKEPQLATVHDKFYSRKVSEVLVYCSNKEGGCEWKGEIGRLKQHIESCLKRLWKCPYCHFSSNFDAELDHVINCTHYPTTCPNQCDIGTIPRCEIEEHLTKCPLQVVACDFVDAGCTVKTTRQDLHRHMEESQQQHLLSATLLNLRLTRGAIAEKDRQLAEKDRQLAEKDKQLQELRKELKLLQASCGRVEVGVDRLLGGMKHCHEFTLNKISQWREWVSEPFYSHQNGYRLKLSMKKEKPSGHQQLFGMTLSNLIVGLVLCKGEADQKLSWPVTFFTELQLLDQLNQQKHYQRSYEFFFAKQVNNELPSEHLHLISRSLLYPDGERSRHVVSDCIKVRLWLYLK